MVFKGFVSNNWMVTAAFTSVGVAAYWEFCGALMSPVASICFPQLMGKYDSGKVKGFSDGNNQYLRIKTAWDSKPADYSKYTQQE